MEWAMQTLYAAAARIIELERQLVAEQTAHSETRYELEQERLQLRALDKAYRLKVEVCCQCRRGDE